MTTAQDTVKSYMGDLIAALNHVHGAVEKQIDNERLTRIHGAAGVVKNIEAMLNRQISALEARVEALGGAGAMASVKDAMTSVTGFFTALYGAMRQETASRLLRDDHTALGFLSICTGMLHTTALAVGDSATAQLTRQHLNDFPPLIMALNEVLPRAVVADLGADEVPIARSDAAEIAVEHMVEAWQSASPQTAA